MSNFSRVLRLALKHRLTVFASIVCSLAIALLWAGNFSALMPVVDGVMHGKSIPELVEGWIASAEERIAQFDTEITAIKTAPGSAASSAEVDFLQSQRQDEREWLGRLRALRLGVSRPSACAPVTAPITTPRAPATYVC